MNRGLIFLTHTVYEEDSERANISHNRHWRVQLLVLCLCHLHVVYIWDICVCVRVRVCDIL